MTPRPDEAPKRPGRVRVSLTGSMSHMVDGIAIAFERKGDVLKVAGLPIDVFFFRQPEHIKQIYSHPVNGQTKCPIAIHREKWLSGRGGHIHPGGAEWKTRRVEVQQAFSREHLNVYAARIPELMHTMLEGWAAFAGAGTSLDVRSDIQVMIARFNFGMLFSRTLGDDEALRIAGISHYISEHYADRLPLWIPLPSHLKFRACWAELRGYFLDEIRRRRLQGVHKQDAHKQDVLSVLVALRDTQTGAPWSEREILDELASVYFGSAIMGTGLIWMLHALGTNTEVQEKLIAETYAVAGNRLPALRDLARLRYTMMVVREAVRLYPPSWALPRLSKEPMEVDGYQIPKNALLVPAIYFVHRHPAYWPEPDRFDPERFSVENTKKIVSGSYFPFGRGQRTCLGLTLAPMVFQLALATLFQRYRVQFEPQGSNPKIDFGFELLPSGPIHVRLAPIESDKDFQVAQ